MKKISSLFIFFFSFFVFLFAQQPQRVDLSEATTAITTSLNALNSLYQDLSKQGDVDTEIKTKIRSISSLVIPCREAVINANYNANSMTEDKNTNIVSAAREFESTITEIDTKESTDSILSKLSGAERTILDLSKSFGIKIKKSKKK